jgi:hypothetical protein
LPVEASVVDGLGDVVGLNVIGVGEPKACGHVGCLPGVHA